MDEQSRRFWPRWNSGPCWLAFSGSAYMAFFSSTVTVAPGQAATQTAMNLVWLPATLASLYFAALAISRHRHP
jgi:hypothetical protein